MQIFQRRSGAALALLGAGTALGGLVSAGCGSTSTDATARIRAVDVATNAGTAAILVNSGAAGGDLTFGTVTPYNFIGQGADTFAFTTTATLPANITYPPGPTLTLNNNSFYTAYLIGRSDVNGKADPRFLQALITGDRGAAANYTGAVVYADPPSGQANVRIINGAPDAGAADVTINGKPGFSAVAYPAFPVIPLGQTTANAPAPATLYQAVPAGTLSVQVNAAGTATVLVPSTNVSVSGGNSYTIVVTEPAVTPTYGLQTLSDQQQ